MRSHFVNKLRDETEFHDMVLSFENFCSPSVSLSDYIASNIQMKEEFSNFAKKQDKDVAENIIKIIEKQGEINESYIKYHNGINEIPKELSKFLDEIKDLKNLMKNVQESQQIAKKLSVKEKKSKEKLDIAKSKQLANEKIQKLEEDYNEAKQQYEKANEVARAERNEYIQKSDGYTLTFPCSISDIIIDFCQKRKDYIQGLAAISDDIIQIANEFSHQEKIPQPFPEDPIEFDSSEMIKL